MSGLSFTLTDNSGLFKAAKDEDIARALEAAGIHLEGEAKDELENDPRRVDTGRLKNSISHAVQGNTLYVGTNVEYGPYVIQKPTKERAAWLLTAFSATLSSGTWNRSKRTSRTNSKVTSPPC